MRRIFLAGLLLGGHLTGVAQWVQANGPTGAEIRVIYSSGNQVLAGSNGGGIFASTNSGTSWGASNTGMTNLWIRCFGGSGSNVFVGTAGGGILYSSDGGKSWHQTSTGVGYVSALAVNGNYLFAGVDNSGIFVSSDNGASWSGGTFLSNRMTSILAVNESIFTTGWSGLFMSTSNGASWTKLTQGLPSTSMSALAAGGIYIYVGTDAGVFVSTNNGSAWTACPNGLSDTYIRALSVSGSAVLAGTPSGVYRSSDKGASWTLVNGGLTNTNVYGLTLSGSTFLAATSGGVFASSDDGKTWIPANSGLANTDVTSLALNPPFLCVSATGIGALRTTDQGGTWTNISGGLMGTNVRTLTYSGTTLLAGTDVGIYRSTDNGATWVTAGVGLANTSVRCFAATPSSIFAGTDAGVYLSTDGGGSWSGTGTTIMGSSVTSLARKGLAVVAGTSTGIYLSTDNGVTWNARNNGVSPGNVLAVTINDSALFAGTTGGAFRSTDSGLNWSASATGLPPGWVYSLLSNAGGVFAGTSIGVFVSTNNGGSWVAGNASQANVTVQTLNTDGTTLYAGGFGQGVWRRPISEMLPMFSLSRIGVGFNPTVIGRTSWDSLMVRNQGGLTLNISNASSQDTIFGIVPSWGSVAAHDSMKFFVKFKPTYGSHISQVSGTIRFVNNALDSPQSLGVHGWAFDTVFIPSTYNVDFGGVAVSGSKIDSLSVFNQIWEPGNTLNISRVWCEDSLTFSVSPRQAVLTEFQRVTFRITFRPFIPGELRSKVLFAHSWGDFDTITVHGYGLPLVPALSFPADRATNQPRSLQLQWGGLSGTDFYHVQLASDSLFAQMIVNDTTLTALTRTVNGLDTSTVYFWRVRGKNAGGWGNFSAPSRFKTIPLAPLAPVLDIPQDNATALLRPVTLRWLSSQRAVSYRVRVSTLPALTSPIVDTLVTGLSFDLNNLAPDQSYYWGVIGGNTGGDSPPSPVRAFHTAPGPPAAPFLLLPANNAIEQPLTVRFAWNRPAKTDSFHLQISDTLTFTRNLQDIALVDTAFTFGPLTNQRTYFWRVSAENAGGTGVPSDVFRFTTVPFPPAPPVLSAPPDRDSTQTRDVTLRWNVTIGATGYQVQLSRDPTMPPASMIVDDSSLASSLSRSVTSLDSGYTYYWRARAKNAGGWGTFCANWSFFVPVVPPAPQLQSPGDKANQQDPSAVQFGWTDVGAAGYDLRVALDSLMRDTVVTASKIAGHTKSVTGLAYNTTYFWSVRSIGSNNLASAFTTPVYRFTTKPDWVYPTTTVNAFPASPTSQDYRLVSFPGGTAFRVNQIFTSGVQGTDWRVFRDTGGTASNHLAELNSSSTLNPGEGYWLLTRGVLEFKQTITMPQLDSKGCVSILVRNGWNIIGNPFGVSIPWQAVLALNTGVTLSTPQTWNGKYDSENTAIQPLKGYYVRKQGLSETVRLPYPFPALQKLVVPGVVMEWRLMISYSIAGRECGTSYAGISRSALEGYDALDEYHPPVILDQPDIFFPRPGWDEAYDRFGSDIRPALGNGQTWDFEVRSKRMSSASIKLAGIDGVPPGMKVVLIGLQNSTPIDMRTHPGYAFVMAADRMTFRLIIGTSEFVDQQVRGLMPVEYALGQNFPNPFNPSTTITYDIPKTSEVELEVVSVLGQRVTLLAQGVHNSGRYTVIWDTHQGGGSGVASGVYFSRLTVDGRSVAVRKMILLK